MLSTVTLDDATGTAVVLHQDAPNGKRWLTSATGLRGVQSLREDKRVRSQAHGGINQTRFEDGRTITLVGEIMSTVNIEDAFNEFGLVAAPMIQTLDSGPALLKWTEGAGLINFVPNPSFEYDTVSSAPVGWASSGFGALNSGATITTQMLAGAPGGDQCMRVITTNALAFEGAAIRVPGMFLAGVPYVVSAYMRGNVGGETVKLGAADSSVGDFQSTATLALTTTFTRYSFTYTPSATHTNLYVYVETPTAVAVTVFVDDVSVTTASADYFDGDTAGCEWTGTPGNSTSREGHALQRLVKLDGDLDPPFQEGASVLSYQAQFFAEDPRAYSQMLQSVASTSLSAQGGGHTFNTVYPRTYASSGGGTVSFTNNGNRSTPPVFQIHGQCVNPQIVLIGSGQRLVFDGTVNAGSYLEVDADKRTVKLNGDTNRLNFYDGANSSWFDLPAGTSNLQLIAASFDAGAQLTVLGRSAWA